MCELIITAFIVGAAEIIPGTMQVEYLASNTNDGVTVVTVHIPTEDYLSCWNNEF